MVCFFQHFYCTVLCVTIPDDSVMKCVVEQQEVVKSTPRFFHLLRSSSGMTSCTCVLYLSSFSTTSEVAVKLVVLNVVSLRARRSNMLADIFQATNNMRKLLDYAQICLDYHQLSFGLFVVINLVYLYFDSNFKSIKKKQQRQATALHNIMSSNVSLFIN